MRILFIFLFTILLTSELWTQANQCNNLGVWLWHIEGTEYPTIVNLANDLSELGVKRVYVKVADGGIDSIFWTEIVNKTIISVLEAHDIEPWAWSYNYPGNEVKQAEALVVAAQTGYKGYVLDLESEFDGNAIDLLRLTKQFHDTRDTLLLNGTIQDSLPIYLSTWGNPDDHDFQIHVANPFVDAFMPQTYLENWGTSYLENPTHWITVGNEEYRELGATKPIHHIISMEHGNVTSDHVNEFFAASGGSSSIWRIPGSGTPLSIREVWEEVDWDLNFCSELSQVSTSQSDQIKTFPNPVETILRIEHETPIMRGILRTSMGNTVKSFYHNFNKSSIDMSVFEPGLYFLTIETKEGIFTQKIIKTQSK